MVEEEMVNGNEYYVRDGDKVSVLEETHCEKDLGVHVDPNLNFNDHIFKTVKKARRMSGLILRNILNRDKEILIPLYKALIRPVLEYGNVIWVPHWAKDKKLVEKVQQSTT